MPKKRKWTDEQFIAAVQRGRSVRSVLQALGLHATGANYKTVKDTVARLNLDTSHWKGQGYLKGLQHNFSRKISMGEILVEDSTFHNLAHLKARLFRDGLLDRRCTICGLTEWLGKPISLVLDHINGVNNDHRAAQPPSPLSQLQLSAGNVCWLEQASPPPAAGRSRGVEWCRVGD